MIQDSLNDLKTSIGKAHEALKRDLARIRTGRANPDILDSIRVDYYGTPTPLKQVAAISVPEPRLIVLKPFERNQISAIERAINQGHLGLNPSNDGEVVRLPLPPLTEERRKELTKVARAKGEDCKVAIRKARHDTKDMLDELEKSEGEDAIERAKKEMEDIVKGGTAQVDALVENKEKAILEV